MTKIFTLTVHFYLDIKNTTFFLRKFFLESLDFSKKKYYYVPLNLPQHKLLRQSMPLFNLPFHLSPKGYITKWFHGIRQSCQRLQNGSEQGMKSLYRLLVGRAGLHRLSTDYSNKVQWHTQIIANRASFGTI